MKNFLKGILVGIANIIPGISGSALLIVFNLYRNCLIAICNLFKDLKKSIVFLFPIVLGIIIGTFSFSNIINYFFNKYYLGTSIVFVGFIMGTLPTLFKESIKKDYKKSNYIFLIITFVLGIFFLLNKIDNTSLTDISIFKLILVGIIVAGSTIIPGISSTVLLSILGVYSIYIDAISSLKINILIPITIGFVIGVFIFSKLMNYLLNKYYGYTFFAIIGFVIATIPGLVKTRLIFNKESLIGFLGAIIAFNLTNYLLKKNRE